MSYWTASNLGFPPSCLGLGGPFAATRGPQNGLPGGQVPERALSLLPPLAPLRGTAPSCGVVLGEVLSPRLKWEHRGLHLPWGWGPAASSPQSAFPGIMGRTGGAHIRPGVVWCRGRGWGRNQAP